MKYLYKARVFVLLMISVLIFGSCSTSESSDKYNKITPEKAKEMIDSDENVFLLDVRTQEEFDEKHIAGAVLIPDYELAERAEKEITDKDKTILVYCRSGRRSKASAEVLVKLGYTNVYDFGGINDWAYETE